MLWSILAMRYCATYLYCKISLPLGWCMGVVIVISDYHYFHLLNQLLASLWIYVTSSRRCIFRDLGTNFQHIYSKSPFEKVHFQNLDFSPLSPKCKQRTRGPEPRQSNADEGSGDDGSSWRGFAKSAEVEEWERKSTRKIFHQKKKKIREKTFRDYSCALF